MKDENLLYWIWLSERCGVSSKDFGRLITRYESPFDIYRLDDDEVERLEGISPALRARLTDRTLEGAYSILRYCKQKKIDIVSYGDRRYPSRLKNIEDPPVLLYVMGELPDMDNRLCFGMVGTRKMSAYGRSSAYKISYELGAANAVVVSGMALGVDGVCAAGALAAGGKTVAVLGCGLYVVYPKEHGTLMREIAKRGAVISEYPPSTRPNGYNFPKRNRIISGLCQGVLVVEGSSTSGALITAKHAVGQGRELFALPGKINESNSDGPNELIKNGALVALSSDDIISHYDFLYHDCIDYKGFRRAKQGMIPEEQSFKKYGILSVYGSDSADANRAIGENGSASAEKTDKKDAKKAEGIREITEKSSLVTPAVSVVAEEALVGLDETAHKVFFALPTDRAVSPDALPIEGVGIGEIITALTMLEIGGLVTSLPGGMYIRK